MMPGMNPRMMKQAMRRMGIESEEIEAKEVIIKCEGKDILIRNPQVSIVSAMGQKTFQIVGDPEEVSATSEEDIKTVMDQANCSYDKAKEALRESEGDLAAAILHLK
jgi:nascent polypeptide-associated complex subunit alpha